MKVNMLHVLVFVSTITIAVSDLPFQQSEHHVSRSNIIVDSYNKNYAKTFVLGTSRYNRTHKINTINLNLLKDVTADFWLEITTYLFRNNQYQLLSPMNAAMKISDILNGNYLGIKEVLSLNKIPNTIPIPKGNYSIKDLSGDGTKMIPFILTGKYKITYKLNDKKLNVATISWYGSAEEKLKRRE